MATIGQKEIPLTIRFWKEKKERKRQRVGTKNEKRQKVAGIENVKISIVRLIQFEDRAFAIGNWLPLLTVRQMMVRPCLSDCKALTTAYEFLRCRSTVDPANRATHLRQTEHKQSHEHKQSAHKQSHLKKLPRSCAELRPKNSDVARHGLEVS